MKTKLKPDFVPKWRKQMPSKHRKKDGNWLTWQHPQPTKSLTNHERMLQQKINRDRKILMLKELIRQAKEKYLWADLSYSDWTWLAVEETKQKLYEDI